MTKRSRSIARSPNGHPTQRPVSIGSRGSASAGRSVTLGRFPEPAGHTIETLLWHDYETFGTHPGRDRPAQFAALRTNRDLGPIEDPVVLYCRPSDDYLPQPEACLVTGITPQIAHDRGLPEPAFAARIHDEMARPGTCVVGYNSLRFDDEFTRYLLYRNFFDPYEREYRNGNSRWDLIDPVRAWYALRPDGLEWPEHEPGRPSFRLEDLSAANGLDHRHAHDALSDVEATIALARRMRERQPRLFDWCLRLRTKAQVQRLIDVVQGTPLVHVSSRYPADRGCLAVVAPLCAHPTQRNATVVADLGPDPDHWANLDVDTLQHRLFSPSADLGEGVERVPVKLVHANRCPMLAPLNVLKGVDLGRIGLDLDRCLSHHERLMASQGLAERLRQVYRPPAYPARDVDEALYDGFISDRDRATFPALRSAPPESLAGFGDRWSDPRLPELLFRYRARHHPATLSAEEQARWLTHCRQALLSEDEGRPSRWRELERRIAALSENADPRSRKILSALDEYGRALAGRLGEGL